MPRFSANLSFLYPELAFPDRFAAAAADGFAAVEYVGPYDQPAATVAGWLSQHRLQQALFNTPAGDWAAGERGIACLPERVEEFRTGLQRAALYATELGCPQVNVLAGIVGKAHDPALVEKTFVDNLKYAADLMEARGVRLLIEPINQIDIPGFYLSGLPQTERVLAAVASPNLFIQFDFYHVQIMHGDLMRNFRRLQPRIAHVQIADNPGRNEPGTGEISYAHVLNGLDQAGYSGWVGCEYRPSTGAGAARDWMDRIIPQSSEAEAAMR